LVERQIRHRNTEGTRKEKEKKKLEEIKDRKKEVDTKAF
jgi:hypothetical protein